jgi:chromosome segregation ATPase
MQTCITEIIETELRDEIASLKAINAQLKEDIEKLRESNGKLRWQLTRFEVAVENVAKYTQLPKELDELREVRGRVGFGHGQDNERALLRCVLSHSILCQLEGRKEN